MKQKILFNLFFKIYAKKLPLSRKTYIFVQNGSIYPKPELSFSAYPPEIYPQTLPFFCVRQIFLENARRQAVFFSENPKTDKPHSPIWRTKSKSGARASTTSKILT